MKNKGHDALFVDNKSVNLIDHKQNSARVAVLHSKVFMGKAHVSLQAVAKNINVVAIAIHLDVSTTLDFNQY